MAGTLARHTLSGLPKVHVRAQDNGPREGSSDLTPTKIDPNIKTLPTLPTLHVDPVEAQLATLARWVQHILPHRQLSGANLPDAAQDGTLLADLIQAISGEEIMVHAQPAGETEALENLCGCFKFLKETAGVDTRRVSFTDFYDRQSARVATMLFRVLLWGEFDHSWLPQAKAEVESSIALNVLDSGVHEQRTKVGVLEEECGRAMLSWVQSRLGAAHQVQDAMSFADGEILGAMVAMVHSSRFQELEGTFDSLFSVTKHSDFFHAEDTSAAEKCAEALKVGASCLGIPSLLDPETVGRDHESLVMYLTVARKRIEAYERRVSERHQSKADWAAEEEQRALEIRIEAEAAGAQAELARLLEIQTEAEQMAELMERREREKHAEFQERLTRDRQEEEAREATKAAAVRKLEDTKAANAASLKELSEQLKAGLVSLEGKSTAYSQSLVEGEESKSGSHLVDMQERVQANREAIQADIKSAESIRRYDLKSQVSAEALERAVQEAKTVVHTATVVASDKAAMVEEVMARSEQSLAAIHFQRSELQRKFEADQDFLNQELQLTQLALTTSPPQRERALHARSQSNLARESAHREQFQLKQQQEMECEVKELADQLKEGVDAKYRSEQVAEAVALRGELLLQRKVPHPLEPYLADDHPLQPVLASLE